MENLAPLIKQKIAQIDKVDKVTKRSRLLGKDFQTLDLPIPQIRKSVAHLYLKNKTKKFNPLLSAESLFQSPIYEHKMAGIFLLSHTAKKVENLNLHQIKSLVTSYLDEWSLVDTFATEVITPYLIEHWPQKEILLTWTKSDNPWLKRSALVTTIKCKDKVPHWDQFSTQLLNSLEGKQEKIVDKAISWLEREK